MILSSRRVVTGGEMRPASIHIENGIITAITPLDPAAPATDHVILPGLVDTHVHINEPGRTHWEGFETATQAAAAGGVTTLIEMPLNSIPATTTVAAYREKLAAAEGKLTVDVGFWGGVVPGNASQLEPLWHAGVFGFKCFLVPSGVPEFEHVSESDLRQAMPILARLGAPLLVHAESPDYLPARPPESECDAIAMMIRLSRETGARVHIVHLAAIEALPLIEKAQAEGVPITVETCPHYVAFEKIPEGATEFKCAPPIRGRLRPALARIGMVVSDHSPSPPEMKQGSFDQAWGGIASLELGLSVMFTLHNSLLDLAAWMCESPARLAALDRKGTIAPGHDADLVLFDPDTLWTVHPENLHQRHKLTPYAGRELRGRVRATFLRGEKIYDDTVSRTTHGRCLVGPAVLPASRLSSRLSSQTTQLLNSLPPNQARTLFLQCCSSQKWAAAMTAARPFPSPESIAQTAAKIWRGLAKQDWLEAFAAHPRIGERTPDPRAAAEQSGTASVPASTLDELKHLNREYEAKFGYIYIVCASGKSADQMLALLRARLSNDPTKEIEIAAEEQLSITQLRLEKIGSPSL